MNDLKGKFDSYDKQMEDMNIKFMDFNIIDMFRNKIATEGDSGNTDALLIMVQNIEKKLLKKFEFVDEKIKKGEDETYKIKNELLGIKNNIENLLRNMQHTKEQFEIVFPKIEDVNSNAKIQNEFTKNELRLLIDSYKEIQDIKLDE